MTAPGGRAGTQEFAVRALKSTNRRVATRLRAIAAAPASRSRVVMRTCATRSAPWTTTARVVPIAAQLQVNAGAACSRHQRVTLRAVIAAARPSWIDARRIRFRAALVR